MKTRAIQNEALRLCIAPDVGASPIEFSLRRERLPRAPTTAPTWLPIFRPTSEQALARGDSAGFSSYTLAPYSNRIRDGKLRFRGQTYSLAANWPDGQTIHGDVRMRPFEVEQTDACSLLCRYDSRHSRDRNFPFHYQLSTEYRLQDTMLQIAFALTNTDDREQPAGLGIHPYFVRTLWPGAASPRLRFSATGFYAVDEQIIPRGPAQSLLPQHDFSTPRDVYAQSIDCAFSGWDGRADLSWPDTGLSLQLAADPVFSHFVVYNGDPDGTLALEPVSHATDACNLAERGVPGTGLQVLAPGQTLGGHIRIKLSIAQ